MTQRYRVRWDGYYTSIEFAEELDPEGQTFTACKQEIYEYHRRHITDYREALKEISALRKTDITE